MKSIVKITQRLVPLFLVLVTSGIMFLSSPAIAASSSLLTVTDKNVETEVIEASKSKPVIAILIADLTTKSLQVLGEVKAEAEKFYGDKYKIVVGKREENKSLSEEVFIPQIFPTPAIVVGAKNGKLVPGGYLFASLDFTELFTHLKEELDKTS